MSLPASGGPPISALHGLCALLVTWSVQQLPNQRFEVIPAVRHATVGDTVTLSFRVRLDPQDLLYDTTPRPIATLPEGVRVLAVEKLHRNPDRIYVGKSARTNADGITSLAAAFPDFEIIALDLPPHVLHLKCVVSPLDHERVLLADGSLDAAAFPHVVTVPAAEAYAANCVAIEGHAIIADGFPRTRDAVERAGLVIHAVPTTEVRKADGSLTCQSILIPS